MRSLEVGEQVTVLAQVQRTAVRPMRQRRGNMLEVTIGDGSGGDADVAPSSTRRGGSGSCAPGRWGLFAGKVTEFRGKRQLNGPAYQLLGADADDEDGGGRGDRGVRRGADPGLSGGGGRADLGDRQVRADGAGHRSTPPDDPLPAALRASRNLVGIGTALREIHRPSSEGGAVPGAAPAQVGRGVRRAADAGAAPSSGRPRSPGTRPAARGRRAARGVRRRPALRADRRASATVGEEIAADLARAAPDAPAVAGRGRLRQDAGGGARDAAGRRRRRSGRAARPDRGARRPAPPRHQRPARRAGPGRRAGRRPRAAPGSTLLTGSLGAAARRAALAEVADGTRRHRASAPTPCCTRASTSPTWAWWWSTSSTGSGSSSATRCGPRPQQPPHVLVMTATPIPRTVAMTVYGDLETSTLSQLPRGRSPIASHVVPASEKPAFLDRAWRAAPRGGRGRPPGLRGVPADRRGARRRRGRGAARRRRAGAAAAAGGDRGGAAARRGAAARAADRASCTAGCPPTRRTR